GHAELVGVDRPVRVHAEGDAAAGYQPPGPGPTGRGGARVEPTGRELLHHGDRRVGRGGRTPAGADPVVQLAGPAHRRRVRTRLDQPDRPTGRGRRRRVRQRSGDTALGQAATVRPQPGRLLRPAARDKPDPGTSFVVV